MDLKPFFRLLFEFFVEKKTDYFLKKNSNQTFVWF